jgi:hypothetical protein
MHLISLLTALAAAETIPFQITVGFNRCYSLVNFGLPVFVITAQTAKGHRETCEKNIFEYDTELKTIKTPGKFASSSGGTPPDMPGFLGTKSDTRVTILPEPVTGWEIDFTNGTISLNGRFLRTDFGLLEVGGSSPSNTFTIEQLSNTAAPEPAAETNFILQTNGDPFRCPRLIDVEGTYNYAFTANWPRDEKSICDLFTLRYDAANGIIRTDGKLFTSNETVPGLLSVDANGFVTVTQRYYKNERWIVDFENNTWTFQKGSNSFQVNSRFGNLGVDAQGSLDGLKLVPV